MCLNSKILEKTAESQIREHIISHNYLISDPFQPAYRAHHSTETALIKVLDDILKSLDSKKTVALLMLDISAAFDTVDHNILLRRMSGMFEMRNLALDLFKSCSSKRSFTALVDNVESEHKFPACGIPQGSVHDPLLFTMYLKPLGKIIEQMGFSYYCYAGDV